MPDLSPDLLPVLELDTYAVLDRRPELAGTLGLHGPQPAVAALTAEVSTGRASWRLELRRLDDAAGPATPALIAAGTEANTWSVRIPLQQLAAGYYGIAIAIVFADGRCAPCTTVAAPGGVRQLPLHVVIRGERAAAPANAGSYRKFVEETVATLWREQSARLGGRPDGTPFITCTLDATVGYQSIGATINGRTDAYWFPETPFEYAPTRADLAIWPVLERLADGAHPEWRAAVEAMAAAFARHAFHPRSGLGYLATEADFDVVAVGPCGTLGCEYPRFKPTHLGLWPSGLWERLWTAAPTAMARMAKAAFYALVTDSATMDFDRHAMSFDFDDRARVHQLTPNTCHCGFSSAATSLIRLWSAAFAHTGDAECLDWAGRMAAKWRAVQHPGSGLVPYCFGAQAPNGPRPIKPVEFSEPMDSAWSALALSESATDLARRPEGTALATVLSEMSLRLARGVARYGFDEERQVFQHFTHLDGRPYEQTARYCFRNAAEKAAALQREPNLARVPIFDGFGFYEPGPYWLQTAGTAIPLHVATVAARTRDPELLTRLRPWAERLRLAAAAQTGPFTTEGKWTFTASGVYVKTLLLLAAATGRTEYCAMAQTIADAELARLRQVTYPHWWRLRDRTGFLAALLDLDQTRR